MSESAVSSQPGTLEYFNEQCVEMRRIWGSTEYTVEQVGAAWEALLTLAVQLADLSDKENERVNNVLAAMQLEYDRRLSYRIFGF